MAPAQGRAWLATWLQGRRRARGLDEALPPVPPTPVMVSFVPTDGGSGLMDVDIAWSWNGLGWGADGLFEIYIFRDDGGNIGPYIQVLVTSVAANLRTVFLPAICTLEDTTYYCQVRYRKGAAASDYSNWLSRNPI